MLSAGSPLEGGGRPIGRRSVQLVDSRRSDRVMLSDVWYPAEPQSAESQRSTYEVLPGIRFLAAAAIADAPIADGRFPLIVMSHGRTGTRFAYSLLCEALAARGAIVVSSDHPGDGLFDWAFGSYVDDETNEINRYGDVRFLLDSMLSADAGPLSPWSSHVDAASVTVIGHSYGTYSGFSAAAGTRGLPSDERISALVGLQPYARTMSERMLSRITQPLLIVNSVLDRTTPAATDADRIWAYASSEIAWRLDLTQAGHQAASDVGLYAELAPQAGDIPKLVSDYLEITATDVVGVGFRAWRDNVRLQMEAIWTFIKHRSPGSSHDPALLAEHDLVIQRR